MRIRGAMAVLAVAMAMLPMLIHAAIPPKIPDVYEVSILYRMPYIGLEEPIRAAVDEPAGLQRLDFYDGLNTFIFNASGLRTETGVKETAIEILPVVDHKDCFAHPTMGYRKVLPDTAGLKLREGGTTTLAGVACDVWELDQKVLNTTSQLIGTYLLYTDAATGLPVRYHMLGHNTLFGGSHNDEYQVEYSEWKLGGVDEAQFHLPEPYTLEACIENSKHPRGDTVKPWRNPRDDLVSFFPEAQAEREVAFEEYKRTFAKTYESDEDHNNRHLVFHWNLRFIHSFNRQGKKFWLGVNHLTDWTRDELRQLAGKASADASAEALLYANRTYVPATASPAQLPDAVNWTAQGAVTPVKDQGSCGSCWSFGTTGTIEGQAFRQTGRLTPLSQQELMDCTWPMQNRACNGGEDTRSYRWLLENTGGAISTEASYGPYLNAAGWCHWEKATPGARINGYVALPKGDMHAFNDALANVGPLSVGIDATQPSFYFYAGGLYEDPECGKKLDHIVLAVGYKTVQGQKYTLVKNSWSTYWGQDGYILVSQRNNDCGLANGASFPLMAAEQPGVAEAAARDESITLGRSTTPRSLRAGSNVVA